VYKNDQYTRPNRLKFIDYVETRCKFKQLIRIFCSVVFLKHLTSELDEKSNDTHISSHGKGA